MKKQYSGELVVLVGPFQGEFGDLIRELGENARMRFIADKGSPTTSAGSTAFGGQYGIGLRTRAAHVISAKEKGTVANREDR